MIQSKLKLLTLILFLATALLAVTNQAHAQTLALSRYSGQPGTVVTLSGSGYTPGGYYEYCLSSSATSQSCLTMQIGGSFTSTPSGTIPAGTTLTIPATIPGTYYVVSFGIFGHIWSSSEFVVLSLTVYPALGQSGTVVTLTGSGYISNTSYSYCLGTSSDSVSCVGGPGGTFTSTLGGIPGGTTLTVPPNTPGGSYYIIVYQGSTVIASSAFTVTSLNLSASSGQPGSVVTLTGAGYASSSATGGLNFCLSTSNSTVSCMTGSSTSLTPTSSGAIPAGTTLTIPPMLAGNYYVIIYQGSTVISSTPFNVTGITQGLPTSAQSIVYSFGWIFAIVVICGFGAAVGLRSYTLKQKMTMQERARGFVQARGKISLEELSTKLGLTVSKTEDLVARMIAKRELVAKIENGYAVSERVGPVKVPVTETTTTTAVYQVKCSHCGTLNPATLQNCTRCGAPLETE